ncbi:RWD domain-containing protein 4-like [Liolophura sinensis]|uniref:RWD domain-containing protein 4-like n=1 Tax=Liolophura sinensis TaxID=3198878 RepID=UPI0031580CF8
MSCREQQEEEIEVLSSIYEGDDNYKQLNPTTFQYKYGEDGTYKSFLLEVSWGENYPDESPDINLDLFYNKHLIDSVRETIMTGVKEQVADLLGCAMTYTLFEWVKESWEKLLTDQPETPQIEARPVAQDDKEEEVAKKKEKREHLSKAQKRKIVNRLDAKGELPRGYDWVDIVKHLSQSGGCNTKPRGDDS